MEIKVNYTAEKGLVQELVGEGQGAFNVEGSQIGKQKVVILPAGNKTLSASDDNTVFMVPNAAMTITIPNPTTDLIGIKYKFVARRDFTNTLTIQTENSKLIGNILYYDRSASDRADKDKTRVIFNADVPQALPGEPAAQGDNVELICLAEGQAGNDFCWFVTGFAKSEKGIYFN